MLAFCWGSADRRTHAVHYVTSAAAVSSRTVFDPHVNLHPKFLTPTQTATNLQNINLTSQRKHLLLCDLAVTQRGGGGPNKGIFKNQRQKKEVKKSTETDGRSPTCGQQLHRRRRRRRRFLSQTLTPSTGCSLEDTKSPCRHPSGRLHGSRRSLG